MKYADEVMELMRPYPGRRFKMAEIVRSVRPAAAGPERQRIRNGVLRVLTALEENGSIERQGPECERGDYALYSWKVPHALSQKCRTHFHKSASQGVIICPGYSVLKKCPER